MFLISVSSPVRLKANQSLKRRNLLSLFLFSVTNLALKFICIYPLLPFNVFEMKTGVWKTVFLEYRRR